MARVTSSACPHCSHRKVGPLITALGAATIAVALVGATAATATVASHASIKACASDKTGALRLAGKCHAGERAVTWAVQGPRGANGAHGAKGVRGPAGPTTDLAPSGMTQRGALDLQGTGSTSGSIATDISFAFHLSAAPTVEEVDDSSTDATCGSIAKPVAAPGYLCLYILDSGNALNHDSTQGVVVVQNPTTRAYGAAAYGALVSATTSNSQDAYVQGSWEVTAP